MQSFSAFLDLIMPSSPSPYILPNLAIFQPGISFLLSYIPLLFTCLSELLAYVADHAERLRCLPAERIAKDKRAELEAAGSWRQCWKSELAELRLRRKL